MATVSGACIVNKMSGLLQIREDTAPSKLFWKAVDQEVSVEIPLNNLANLKASLDLSPKMILKLFYNIAESADPLDLKMTFNNRQTMNAVKECLQTIMARQKTVINDKQNSATPEAGETSTRLGTPSVGDPLDFSKPQSLSDASLLKNRELQQKYLLEDKALRNVFTQSVIKFKLSPTIFWLSRIGQLRTYALTISQHRGPYNVLSTIKPVATSDNQVNVNVTRDTINEIFETYPIIRQAYNELVPSKLSEGEFWSRFFNSKLFRRLRGEKINSSKIRGDMIIDRYLHVDADFVEKEAQISAGKAPVAEHHVNRFLDLEGNAEDNSQKLGPSPDITMKYSFEETKPDQNDTDSFRKENEMVVLMRNMNKLSKKMVTAEVDDEKTPQLQEIEKEAELDLGDLNELLDLQYIELNLNSTQLAQKHETKSLKPVSSEEWQAYVLKNSFESRPLDLRQTYESRGPDFSKVSSDVYALVRHNNKTYRLLHHVPDPLAGENENLLPESEVQELITLNVTVTEFLLHFWHLFLHSGNPVQLKKLFANLRNCQQSLAGLEARVKSTIDQNAQVKQNEKLKDKLHKDLETCSHLLKAGLATAVTAYAKAVRQANEAESSNEVNENGKRTLVN